MRAEDHRLGHGPPPLSEMHRRSVCACACPDSNRDAKARRSERRVSADSTTGAYETNRRSSLPQVRPAGLEPAPSSFGGSRSAPAELRTLALSLPESNQRPRVYQTRALPTELRDIVTRLEGVEPAGFEPAAPWSRTTCAPDCATARRWGDRRESHPRPEVHGLVLSA